MNRLRSFFVLAAMLALAIALPACGDGNGDSGGAGGGDAQTVIDDATFEGIESGVLDLTLAVDVEGQEGGKLDLSLSGPFQGGMEKGEKPQFDLAADVDGSFGDEEIDFEGGLVLLPNSAYVNYDGVDYEVDPTTFSIVESALKQAQGGSGDEGSATACQQEFAKIDFGDFVKDAADEGSAEVEGVTTTKVSGDLNVFVAPEAVLDALESSPCRAQLEAAGDLPPRSQLEDSMKEVDDALESAHIDVYVGDDDIIRRVTAEFIVDAGDGPGRGAERATMDMDLTLGAVNEEQEISAPEGAKPLNDLFLKLGVNPIELLQLLQGGGGAPDIGGLLEGLGAGGSTGGSGGGEQAELRCLGEARTPVDIQKCLRRAG